ncbi:hypothetical protein B566_EDAN004083 [Ephemera danica]|nr:hypothetical protein B566_EDAN004083 [Ephemera danica]
MIDDEVWASCQIFAEKIANAANDSMKTSWSKGYPQEAAHHLMLLTHTVNQFEFTWMPRLLVFLKNLAKSRIDTTLEITALYCIKATFVLLFKFEPVDELVSQKGELLDLLLAILKKQDAIDNVRVLCKSKNAETLENAVVILKRVCALPVTKDIFKSCVQNLLNFLMLAEEFPEIELFQNIIYEALTKKLCSFMTPAKIQRFNQEDVFFFHHGGIIFATSDENYGCYPFLGILEKFIKLLSKEKCKEIKQFIESKTKSMDNDSAIGFVKNYHLALLQQEKRLSELEKRILVKTVRKPKIPKEKKSPRPPQLPSPSVISESSPLPHTSRKPNARHTERSLEVQDRQTTKSKVTKRKEDLQKPAEKKRKLAVHDSSTEDIEMASTSSHEQSTKSLSTSHDQTSQVPMNSSNDAGSPTLKISHEMSEVSLINTKTVENMTRFSNLTEHCTSSDAANESDSDCSL